jgi:hypothetical protein
VVTAWKTLLDNREPLPEQYPPADMDLSQAGIQQNMKWMREHKDELVDEILHGWIRFDDDDAKSTLDQPALIFFL